MNKKELLINAGIEVHKPIESLFHRGGTTIIDNKEFILINNDIFILDNINTLKGIKGKKQDILWFIKDDKFYIINKHGFHTRKIKINISCNFVYKFMKTIVKTIDKDRLIKHFKNEFFNSWNYATLENIK